MNQPQTTNSPNSNVVAIYDDGNLTNGQELEIALKAQKRLIDRVNP